ncbi:hypothetical protein HMPREF9538_04397 [Klebsiella sp. MS 92-3]|nr:hypothetical protein HMPREF9538_04397 [Klebsiella sp. MS 92-3]
MNGDSLLNNSGCKQPVKNQENKTVFNSGDTLCPAPGAVPPCSLKTPH